jgi:predicted phosphodiesterase
MATPGRIAVVSDIHGNAHALEAVLACIRAMGDVEMVVNCGDILSGPVEPAATADLLIELAWPTIRGNHERQLLACAAGPGAASDQFAFEATSDEHRRWLAGLPEGLDLGGEVLVCHGTPGADLEYLLETVTPRGMRAASWDEVAGRLGEGSHGLVLCGHSHTPRAMAMPGGPLVVNPGSVGLQAYDADYPHPHEAVNGSPHARFAVCERGARGWSVRRHAVAYDWDRAADTAKRNGREDWEFRLRTGRNP